VASIDPFPTPQEPTVVAEDHELVRALTDARRLVDDQPEDAAWRELAGRLDRILEVVGVEGLDPTSAPAVDAGTDRPTVGQGTADNATASLRALLDRPDEDQLDLANQAIRDLETGLT
jgi:hypothetical protein